MMASVFYVLYLVLGGGAVGSAGTESFPAFLCIALNHFLCNHRAAPCGFIGFHRAVSPLLNPVSAGFKGIAQIDADSHILHQRSCGDIAHFRYFCFSRSGFRRTVSTELLHPEKAQSSAAVMKREKSCFPSMIFAVLLIEKDTVS